jgi:hypothetical protein
MPHRCYGDQNNPTYEQDGPHDQKALNQPLNHPFNLVIGSISPPRFQQPMSPAFEQTYNHEYHSHAADFALLLLDIPSVLLP